MDKQTTESIQTELARVQQGILAQEGLRGILPDEQIEAVLAALRQKEAMFLAQLQGSGAVAQGEGAKVLGQKAIDASGATVEGLINTGEIKADGDVVGRDKIAIAIAQLIINQQFGPDREKLLLEAMGHYLSLLGTWCNALPLAALSSSAAAEELTLAQVYVELDTETRLKEKEGRLPAPPGRERRLSALAAATEHSRLVLLGGPGSGKSSFVQWLVGWLAQAGRGEASPPEGWQPLLPLFVRLRELAPALAAEEWSALCGADQEQRLREIVVEHWQHELRRTWKAPLLAEELERLLAGGQMLLVFDGLDEITETVRPWAPQAVRAVLRAYPQIARVIVTCRVRSYTGKAKLTGFHQEQLAPFDEDKIRAFVGGWYGEQKALLPDEKKQRIEDLQVAATKHDLIRLAEIPMLLTTMAIIHQQQTRLPRERVRVYDEAVKILLYRWQEQKGAAASTALKKVLEDPALLRKLLERLGYEAHRRQAEARGQGERAADLPRGDLLVQLEEKVYLGSVKI